MRGPASKLEDGCVSARFHLASRARTRAVESYGVGQAQVQFLVSLTFFGDASFKGNVGSL